MFNLTAMLPGEVLLPLDRGGKAVPNSWNSNLSQGFPGSQVYAIPMACWEHVPSFRYKVLLLCFKRTHISNEFTKNSGNTWLNGTDHGKVVIAKATSLVLHTKMTVAPKEWALVGVSVCSLGSNQRMPSFARAHQHSSTHHHPKPAW